MSTNPFASFMPMSDSEVEAARLSLSEDEISNTIDTFGPLRNSSPPRSRKSKNFVRRPPPPPGVSALMRNSEESTTEKFDMMSVDSPEETLGEISVEELIVPEKTPPLDSDSGSDHRSSLAFKLGIAALLFIVAAIIGLTYLLTQGAEPTEPTPARESTSVAPSPIVAAKLDTPAPSPEPVVPPVPADEPEVEAASTFASSQGDKALPEQKTHLPIDEEEESTITVSNPGASAAPEEDLKSGPSASSPKEVDTPTLAPSDPPKPEPTETLSRSIGPISTADTVIIKLNGLPRDAAVSVDGVVMDSPFEVPRSLKAIKVVVKAPDYETAVKRIVPGQDKAVLVRMTKK